MSRNTLGFVRLVAAASLFGLPSLPPAEAAVVPSDALQKRAELASSIFEIPSSVRNVFPAANFNRNVTTNWWETEVLDGHPSEEASDLSSSLKNASFIVLDQDFYQVR